MTCPIFRPVYSGVNFDSCGICRGEQRETDESQQSTIIVGHIAGGSGDSRIFHLFHETCLQSSLTYRRKCPICNLDNVQIITTLPDQVFDAIMNDDGTHLTGSSSGIDQTNLKDAILLAAQMEKSVAFKALLSCGVKLSNDQLKTIISEASQHGRRALITTLISSCPGQEEVIAEELIGLTQRLKLQTQINALNEISYQAAQGVSESLRTIINCQNEMIMYAKQKLKLIETRLKKQLNRSYIADILLVAGIALLSIEFVKKHPHHFRLRKW